MRGVWDGEGNPTRADCIRLAAECATQAAESLPDAQLLAARGWAETAKAWAEIAKAADMAAATNVDLIPVYGYAGGTRLGICQHRMVVLHTGHDWVHPIGFGPCDRPPTD